MYDVLITQEDKIVTIENIQTTIEVSDQIAVDTTVVKEKEPTKKRAKSSSSPTKKKQMLQPQSKITSSPLASSSSSSSPPAIFLHVENTLPKCAVATPDIIDHVMTSISEAIGNYTDFQLCIFICICFLLFALITYLLAYSSLPCRIQ